MTTLLVAIQAPFQSWGISSHFGVRDTCREPTKSGVIGLICAAFGRPKEAELTDLAQLRMGVRVDREGKVMKDYHLAQDVLRASGGTLKKSEPSNRYYLSDAVFLVALEGEKKLLTTIQNALNKPKWLLYLGRKAFVPSRPLCLPDCIKEIPLIEALQSYPLLVPSSEKHLRVVIEDKEGSISRNDVPISFVERRFTNRHLRMFYIDHTGEVLEDKDHVPV